MNKFNILLLLMGAALVALVLDARDVSALLSLLAMVYGCHLKRVTRAALMRKELVDEPDDRFNFAAAVVQGMAWAQDGMVYQIGEGEDRHNPSCALVGREVVDQFSGQAFFLPQIEVVPAGYVALPAYAQAAGG